MSSELISAAGTVFEITKKLVEETMRHGGREQDVRRILNDPTLATALAKKIVGPIWALVGKEVAIDVDVDWETKFIAFCDRQKLSFSPGLSIRDITNFLDIRPTKECRYTLQHFERPMQWKELWHAAEHAGFRELCTYLQAVKLPMGIRIGALQSRWKTRNGAMHPKGYPPTFITAETCKDHRTHVAWTRQETYGTNWFYLVRVN